MKLNYQLYLFTSSHKLLKPGLISADTLALSIIRHLRSANLVCKKSLYNIIGALKDLIYLRPGGA